MTWKELIKLTLQDIRIYGASGNVSAEDEALALAHLNDHIDALKLDGRGVNEIVRTLWTLTSAMSYTIGSGGAINVARPVSPQMIAGFAWMNNNLTPAVESDMHPPLTPTEWQSLAYKTFSAVYPNRFYYEAATGVAVPILGTVYPYPVPSSSGLQGVLYAAAQVDEVVNVNATIVLPPGYRLWYRRALKVMLADPFKSPVDEGTMQRWIHEREEAGAAIGRQNERLEEVSFGVAGVVFGGRTPKSNIYTGT